MRIWLAHIDLISKCLLKIHQILDQIVKGIKMDKLLLKIHLIFCEFDRSYAGGLESENQESRFHILKNLKIY